MSNERIDAQRGHAEADAEDAARIARVARGDLEAFQELFRRYYPRVYGFLRRRLRDPALVEDAVVEVFYELWRSAGRFRGESRASTFLCGIAHFKAMSAVRAQGRSKRSAVIPMEMDQLSQFADPDDLAARIEGRADIRRVREALEALSESQRQVVELAFIEGLPYAEIAARLGVAEGTIKTRVARARARLRVVLGSNEHTESPPEES